MIAVSLTTVFTFLLALLPGGLWCAWFLFVVHWPKVWPVLARGGWVGVVFLGIMAALAWSLIFPRALGPIANFNWQLMAVAALIASALMCGWLQGKLQWTPGEVCFVPSANEARHGEHH